MALVFNESVTRLLDDGTCALETSAQKGGLLQTCENPNRRYDINTRSTASYANCQMFSPFATYPVSSGTHIDDLDVMSIKDGGKDPLARALNTSRILTIEEMERNNQILR